MDENNLELNLEDILKEFDAEAQEPEALDEAIAQMPIAQEPPLEERLKEFLQKPEEDEDVKRFVPDTDKADPAMQGQTIRVDPDQIREAVKDEEVPGGGTIRFEPVNSREKAPAEAEDTESEPAESENTEPEPAESENTEPEPAESENTESEPAESENTESEPAESENTEPEPAEPVLPEGAEPFTANWEPEYENPIGEYVPPEPIVFRPRSRRHELKRKLVAGPERRYYALSEQGLGKLQAAIFLSLLVVILSFVAIGMHSMGLVREERMRLLVFGELFAMLLSALLGSGRIFDGFASVFRGKFTPDTLLGLSFLVCIGDGVFCLQEVRVPFCAAFCLEVTMSLWAEYERRNTEMGQMDTMRKAIRLNRVAKAPDCFEGRPGFYVTDGEVEDFMDTYDKPSTPERMMNIYCLLAFLAATVVAVASGVLGGMSVGMRTWSAAMLTALPATTFICQTRPMAVLERRFHKLGVVLCGWKGVKELSAAAVVPLVDRVLFPAGSMKINGVKFYSRRDPDQVMAYAAAVLECTGNALTPLFTQLRDSRNGVHYAAENYCSYENGGIGGEICGESVLLGTAQFLQEMGVDIPEGTRVSQAVYAAVNGELSGVFALAFGKLKGVATGLGSLCSYRGLTPVIASDNFLLTEGFLRSKFSVNTRRVAFPNAQQRQAVAAWSPTAEDSIPCALTTQDGLTPAAFAITGARALRTATNLGTVVHMLAGIVGIVMVLVLTLVGAGELLTPQNLLLFHLAWCIPGLLITSWTSHI